MTIDTIAPSSSARGSQFAAGDVAAVQQSAGRAPAAAVETAAAVTAKNAAPSMQQLEDAVQKMNRSAQDKSQGIEFSIDEDSKRTVVKVIDQSTKEVLRQIPTPEALAIAKALETRQSGLISQEA